MPITDTTRAHAISESELTNNNYIVGWICALDIELAASRAMLDKVHPALPRHADDSNTYALGLIGQHNVVIACLPSGNLGTTPAAIAAANMLRSFPNIRFGLMVGIGGGAPASPSDDPDKDIHLGDVVVSSPVGEYGGVIQYDFGKTVHGGKFVQTGSLNKPPTVLLTGVNNLRAKHIMDGITIQQVVSEMLASKPNMRRKFEYPGSPHDLLFEASYNHDAGGRGCEKCDKERLLIREARDTANTVVHYGLIGSANQVMKDGATREKLRQEKPILCFEMEAAGLMDSFPCLVIRGICDYSDTHKNDRWQPYAAATAAAYAKELLMNIPTIQVAQTPTAADEIKKVSERMAKIGNDIGSIHKTVNSLYSTQEAEYRIRLRRWLSPIDYATLHSDTLRERQSGTGAWFLRNTAFTGWLEGKHKTLFCPGIPGAGKTMIASIVVDHLRRLWDRNAFPEHKTGVSFLYCIYNRQNDQAIHDLLASLLVQLVLGQPAIPQSIQKLYSSHCEGDRPRLSLSEISQELLSVIKAYFRIFIVIDALDECKTELVRESLLSEIFKLQEQCDIRLMVTFRPISSPKAPQSSVKTLEIRANEEDIEQYLDSQMSQLPGIVQDNYNLQSKIKSRISTLVDGMFLLAQLYINSLTDKLRERDIDMALEKMENGEVGLNRAYNDAINRIKNQQTGFSYLAKNVLMWIVCARRALTTDELIHAVAVERGASSLGTGTLYSHRDMVSSCAGLVTIEQESKIIRLVHYTTQEYLQRELWEKFPEVRRDTIATNCLTYLSFDVFAQGGHSTDEIPSTQYPFLDYAAQNWASHTQDTQKSVSDLALKFLMDDSKVSAWSRVTLEIGNWSRQHSRDRKRYPSNNWDRRKGFHGMHILAYFGLDEIMTRLLEENDPDTKDSDGRTPLSYASEHGKEAVVKLLLDHNVSTNSKSRNGWSPLSHAVESGNGAVIRLLLTRGANIHHQYQVEWDAPGYDGLLRRQWCTPLSRAAEIGNEAVVKLLLEYGAQPDLKDKDGQTPLSQAIDYRNVAIVQLLLAKGVMMDYDYQVIEEEWVDGLSTEGWGGEIWWTGAWVERRQWRTPLSRAAENGYEEVVKLLLEYGAQPDLEDKEGQTPLSRATDHENMAVMQLLFAKCAKGV